MNEVKARRAKGTGGLYTRKGIYYISYVVNGEKKEESTGTTNYIEAVVDKLCCSAHCTRPLNTAP